MRRNFSHTERERSGCINQQWTKTIDEQRQKQLRRQWRRRRQQFGCLTHNRLIKKESLSRYRHRFRCLQIFCVRVLRSRLYRYGRIKSHENRRFVIHFVQFNGISFTITRKICFIRFIVTWARTFLSFSLCWCVSPSINPLKAHQKAIYAMQTQTHCAQQQQQRRRRWRRRRKKSVAKWNDKTIQQQTEQKKAAAKT